MACQATQSIAATKNAIKMLEKHHSLLQLSLAQLKQLVRWNPRTSRLFQGVKPFLMRTVMSFIQNPAKESSFLQQAPSAGSYAPQSGAIFGILKQMQETFELNSAQAAKEEASIPPRGWPPGNGLMRYSMIKNYETRHTETTKI